MAKRKTGGPQIAHLPGFLHPDPAGRRSVADPIPSSGPGSGDVVGPAVATDNAIARFNGTTGKLLQNSTPIVQDDGRISTVTDPSSAQDAATKAYVDSLAINIGKRARVRVATTASITIATALNNGDTLDGVVLATGDLVLVKDQAAPAGNGIYVVGVTPARSSEFDTYDEHPGTLLAVEEGTTNADTLWLCTSNAGGTLGVTAIAFTAITSGINQLTGDVTAGPSSGSAAATLAASGVAAGTYGDATHVPRITVDAKGRATTITSVAITDTDTGITQLTGDVTAGPGNGSQAATLANSGVAAGTYGNATTVPQITIDAKGRITAETDVPIGSTAGRFGDGSDGALVYDGAATILGMAPASSVYTLTRDIFATNLTVNLGVTILTNNYAIYCTGTLTNNGTINNDGTNGANGSSAASSAGANGGGATNGAGSSTAHYGRLGASVAGTAGGAGQTGAGSQAGAANVGNNASNAVDGSGSAGSSGNAGGKGGTGTGGAGGAARSGAAGGTVSLVSAVIGRTATAATTGSNYKASTATWANYTTPNAGNGGAPGGSGGGGDATNAGGGGGGGGGEGGAAGVVAIFAAAIVNSATGRISSTGGTGGTGGNGRTQATGNVGGGGGGAGGSGGQGGIIWLVYHTLTNAGTITVAGGTHGTGGTKGSPHGTGTDDAANGSNGPDGPAGLLIQIAA